MTAIAKEQAVLRELQLGRICEHKAFDLVDRRVEQSICGGVG
jgi:hypothetical protein